MTWGPVGLWDVRLRALGTRPGPCEGRALTVSLLGDGHVTVAAADGTRMLEGTWHAAGLGRVLLTVVGGWGAVEAAVELDDDGRSCHGRVLGRAAGGTWPATFAAEIVGHLGGADRVGAGPEAVG